MLGGLLRHTIFSNTKMIPLLKVSLLQRPARLSHVQTMFLSEQKTLSMNRDNNRIFNSFFTFFHKNITLFDLLNLLTFLFFCQMYLPSSFFYYRYGSKCSYDVKNKGTYFRKLNFGEKFC